MVKTIGKYVFTFIITMIILIALLFLSSLIPSSVMQENVKKSSEILIENGEKETITTSIGEVSLFYFTDALMINTAYSIDSTHPYISMMLDRKNYIPGQTLNEHVEIEKHVAASPNYVDDYGNTFQVSELYGLMHGENIVDSYEYPRYWHGYLIFLRPLLAIMDLDTIRTLLFTLTIILIIMSLFLIIKKLNIITAFIYLISLGLINIFFISNALNQITPFIIALIAMNFILLKNGKFKNAGTVFLCIGIVTSFFDLLTTPLITLGLTLPLYVLLNIKECNKKLYSDCIKLCVSWAVGYVLCWTLKWVITDLTLNRQIIKDAIYQIIYRTSDMGSYTYLDVVSMNLKNLGKKVIYIFVALLAIYTIIGLSKEVYLKKIKKINTSKIEGLKSLIFVVIALFPFLWFGVIKNHSLVHSFFTNRMLIITILCIQIAFTIFMGLQDNLLKEKEQKLKEKV